MPIKIVQLHILLILHFAILCGCVLICVTSVESTMHALSILQKLWGLNVLKLHRGL